MARGPFFAFRVSFVAVAVACALLLPFSVYSHFGVVESGFGAKAVPVKAVLFYLPEHQRLTIEFDYTSPAHMDSAVRSFNVTVSGGGVTLTGSAPMTDTFYRGESRKMYATVDSAAGLSIAEIITVSYSFEVYSPYRDATSTLTGSAVMPLEVHA